MSIKSVQSERGKAEIIILLLIILLAGFLVHGFKPFEHKDPDENAARATMQDNIFTTKNNLQMQMPQAVTINPTIPITTPAPSNTPTPTAVPTPTSVDFSSPFLDWEDVQTGITTDSPLCQKVKLLGLSIGQQLSPYYCSWQCPTLSNTCQAELNHLVSDEIGNLSYLRLSNNPLAPDTYDPSSRIGLCYADASCKKNGFTHYQGSIPFPNFAPSQTCQNEIRTCFEQSPNQGQISAQNCNDPHNGDCDPSDDICGNHSTCARY